jgi:phosphatidylinositol alpha-1,6-mannosyltransferase
MRLLLVTNDYPPKPGGIQQYLGNIVARHEGPARVLAPADPNATERDHSGGRSEGPVSVVRSDRTWMVPTPLRRDWIRTHIADFRPDVVVYGAPTPLAQIGAVVRHDTEVPFAVMTHGAEVTLPAVVPGLRQVLARTFRSADLVFSVSRFTAGRVAAMSGVKPVVLGAGVDVDAFRPAEAASRGGGAVRLVCVSRFTPRKGHARVVEAAELLARRGVATEVVLVGRGRLEDRLRRRAADASVPVRMLVDVPWSELPDAYRQGDIFVMPARSRWLGLEAEGLGIVYLEAGASGLPVVVGSSGGAPETIVPGQTGYIAVRPTEIADAVVQILDDPQMAARSRSHVEANWTWDVVMERWHRALAGIVGA